MKWFAVTAVLAVASVAAAEKREPIVVVGLRPATGGKLGGSADIKRLSEAQKLRRVMDAVVREIADHPIVDDGGLRTVLGVEYLVDFIDCRGAVACVTRLVGRLKKTASNGVYGGYTVVDHNYNFHIYLFDLRQAKVLKEVEFKLAESDISDRKLWRRELEPLFEAEPASVPPVTPPTTEPPTTDPPASDPGVPELPPISTGPTTTEPAVAASASAPFIDNSVLDAISRGIAWHGHFQNYSAMGVRRDFRRDMVTFDDRLQLEFESELNHVRVVGKPQLEFNVLDNTFAVKFREMYATRDYKRFDLAVGEQIVTWGITDFWPIVDIINPRDFSKIRNWRPIDEKLPVPMLQSRILFGPITLHLIAVPILGQSKFQVDQTQPFALPIPAPPGATIEQTKPPTSLSNSGGGVRVDVAIATWKASVYGLLGRDPYPAVYAQTDPTTGMTSIEVDNDRVAMAATSLVGNLPGGVILKTEAAFYHRLDDECEGMSAELMPGVPQCFYIHRTPTGRANLGLERRLLPGLEGHLQFIAEYTRSKDIPRLPPVVNVIAPGYPEQHPLNRNVTMRLQGNWAKGDFQPMAFVTWSFDDETISVNTDLEYHLSDGLALAVGGFWFQGYAKDPNKDQFTIVGSLNASSNVYLRATAWF